MTVGLILLVSFSGCAELQKKLIRKKQPKPVRPLINVEEVQRPYAELYREHLLYWKTWHSEILKDFNGNPKRLKRDLQEARRHLGLLEKYLQPEQAKTVRSYVGEFDQMTDQIDLGSLSLIQTDRGVVLRELESLGLRISNSLAFREMKGFLLPDPLPFDLSAYEGEEPETAPAAVQSLPPPAEN